MKFPFDFSLKFIFRLIMPGFIVSLSILPLFQTILENLSVDIKIETAFGLLVVFLGWLFVVSDMHIYMLYEGRRYWPAAVRGFFVSRQKSRMVKLLQDKTKAQDDYAANKLEKDHQAYLELSEKLREYNINEESGAYEAVYPTRLGNLIYTFEAYPKRSYGMDSIFYWYRLWLLLDKDTREEVDNNQAIADSIIYSSFALYLSGLITFFYTAMHAAGLYEIEYINEISMIPIVVFQVASGYLVYLLSLSFQKTNGELYRSIFDIYRSRLKIGDVVGQISKLSDDKSLLEADKAVKYEVVWRFLRNYKVKIDGKVVSAAGLKSYRKYP